MAAGLRHLELRYAIETPPLRLPCSAPRGNPTPEAETGLVPDFPCGPARGMAFVRFTPRSRRQQVDSRFFTSRLLLSKPGGQKIALAFVGLSHPGLEFSSFSGGALWHTRSTRQRDERQYS